MKHQCDPESHATETCDHFYIVRTMQKANAEARGLTDEESEKVAFLMSLNDPIRDGSC
jgi:hypothetical protein